MKVFDLLASFHNWLSDKDFIWWPFSFLRPEKHELITLRLILTMTGCFGGLSAAFFTLLALVNSTLTGPYFFITLASSLSGFFLWFSLITRPLWNRRARRLRS